MVFYGIVKVFLSIYFQVLAKFVGHFTSYALDGGTGKIKWIHEPGDFEINSEQDDEVRIVSELNCFRNVIVCEVFHRINIKIPVDILITFRLVYYEFTFSFLLLFKEQNSLHFKLRLKKKALHRGEVHWRKYSQSFLKHLPFSWAHRTDTRITLGEFRRSVSKPSKRTEGHILEQLMVLAKTGFPKSSPEIKTRDLNAVVIRHSRGVEVLDLSRGNPICSLPLDVKHSTLGDVNGDENIDLARFRVYEEDSKTRCFLVASNAFVTSSVLFNSSVCSPSQAVDFFGKLNLYKCCDQGHFIRISFRNSLTELMNRSIIIIITILRYLHMQ